MDTGPQKESDTTGSKETKKRRGGRTSAKGKKKGISRLGQRDRWEITSIQAGRR